MTTHKAEINGLNLVYEREGDGPPIVFFPGGGGNATQWERVIPYVLSGHSCFVLESRGHGRSDRTSDADYRFTTFIKDATQFVREVVAEPAVLVGQSAGGFIAMGVAAELPDLARGVYSEDSAPLIYTGLGVPNGLMSLFRVVSDTLERSDAGHWSMYRFAQGLAEAMPGWAKRAPAGLIDFARMVYGTDPQVGKAVLDSLAWASLDETIAIELALRCPVHVAQADATLGGVVTESHLEGLRHNGVNLSTTAFPGAGHTITATHLAEYVADLRAFIQRLETA